MEGLVVLGGFCVVFDGFLGGFGIKGFRFFWWFWVVLGGF